MNAKRSDTAETMEGWLRRIIAADLRSRLSVEEHRLVAYMLHGPGEALMLAMEGDMAGAGQATFDEWVRRDLGRWEPGRNLTGIMDRPGLTSL